MQLDGPFLSASTEVFLSETFSHRAVSDTGQELPAATPRLAERAKDVFGR